METRSPQLVVVGQCAFTAMVVRRLIREGARPASIIVSRVNADRDPFRGLEVDGSPRWFAAHRYYHDGWRAELRAICATQGLPLVEADDVFDVPLNGDVLLVAGLTRRVPGNVLSQFGAAALNAHTSLLPGFKGPQPEAQVILNAARRSGVSIHTMTARFDDGPVRYQAAYTTPQDSTVGSLERRGAVLAARGVASLLQLPISGWPDVQSDRPPSYYRWYDDKLLDISGAASAEDVQSLLRLRPEGYAYLDIAETRIFPIKTDHTMKSGGLDLDWAGSTFRVTEWVESVVRGGEMGLTHHRLS